MDVREEQVAQVVELESARGESLLQAGDRRRRAAVVQREPVVRVDEVRADHALVAEVAEVDRVHGSVVSGHVPEPGTGTWPLRTRVRGSAAYPGAVVSGRDAARSLARARLRAMPESGRATAPGMGRETRQRQGGRRRLTSARAASPRA